MMTTTTRFFKKMFFAFALLMCTIGFGFSQEAYASNVDGVCTIAYIESDMRFVDLSSAEPMQIRSRFEQSAVDNGKIYIFTVVRPTNTEKAILNLKNRYSVKTKNITNASEVESEVLDMAAQYLGTERFSVVRYEIKTKSNESTEDKWKKGLAIAAGVATVVSLFR